MVLEGRRVTGAEIARRLREAPGTTPDGHGNAIAVGDGLGRLHVFDLCLESLETPHDQ